MNIRECHEIILKGMEVVARICHDNNVEYSLGFGSALGAVRHNGIIPWDADIDLIVPLVEIPHMREVMARELPSNMYYLNWETEPKYPCPHDRICFVGYSNEEVSIDVFSLIGMPSDEAVRNKFRGCCYYSQLFFHCKHRLLKDTAPQNRIKMVLVKPFAKLVPDSFIRRWYKNLETRYDYNTAEYVHVIGDRYNTCIPKECIFPTCTHAFENLALNIPGDYDRYLTIIYGDYLVERRWDVRVSIERDAPANADC